MTGITYVDHDSGATFVHGHVHLRQSDRCLTGTCVNIPLRDRIAAALQSGTVIDAIERIIEGELRLRTDALNRTGASNDRLRAELADANARLANGLKRLGSTIECVEAECQPYGGMCHGYDTTDDDECSLVADLEQVVAALGGGRA